jgi:hypothetical protein
MLRAKTMGTSGTTGFPVLFERASVARLADLGTNRRRSISPDAGRALEKLGHAIEYLADEYLNGEGTFDPGDARLEAVKLLMAINRHVYNSCPEIPTLAERWQSFVEVLRH